jgi:hypothetical protein
MHRRVHTFRKAYNLAKGYAKDAEGDPFFAPQARHYKALAESFASCQKDKDKVATILIP